jgi:hypothetical protein
MTTTIHTRRRKSEIGHGPIPGGGGAVDLFCLSLASSGLTLFDLESLLRLALPP